MAIITRTIDRLTIRGRALYLVSQGWQLDPSASWPGVGVYRLPVERDVEILLPLRRTWSDYGRRMADAVETLGVVEQRSPAAIVADLSNPRRGCGPTMPSFPRHHPGHCYPGRGTATAPGWDRFDLVSRLQRPSTATFFSTPRFGPAAEFLRGCRLGQTERGSYVVTIIAPVPPDLMPNLLNGVGTALPLELEPYPRQVTLVLMASLGIIHEAIQTGQPGAILSGVRSGITPTFVKPWPE